MFIPVKRFLLSLILLVSCLSIVVAQVNPNYHEVKPYTRKDGTRVKGYKRTNPNSTVNDNYSTRGNVNPWTGRAGTVPRDNGRVTAPTSYYRTTPSKSYSYDDRQTANKKPDREIKYLDGTEHFTVTYNKVTSWDREKTYYAYGGQSQGLVSGQGYVSGLLLNGKYAMRYNDGRPLMETNFRKGLLHGKRIGYDKGGELVLKEKYYEGELIEKSDFEGYTETTHIWSVGQVDNPKVEVREYGKLQMVMETRFGKEIVSYYDDGSQHPTRKISFEDGKANGAFEWYYPDTKFLMTSGTYLNDNMNGEVIEFDRSGERESLVTYDNGAKNGPFVLYEEGKRREVGAYEYGVKSGLSTLYDDNGTKKTELNYVQPGIVEYKFFAAGQITEEGRFVNEKRDGLVKTYEDGKIFKELNFRNGELDGKAKIHEEGGYIDANYAYGEKDGRWTFYSDSPSGEAVPVAYNTFVRGTLNGPFWAVQADTILTGNYTNGLKNGAFASYRPFVAQLLGTRHSVLDGVPKMKCQDGEYQNGKRSGTWTTYSPGNKILKIEPFRNGLLHGTVMDYYSNFVNLNGDKEPYASELRETTTYVYGEKTGPATIYSYLEKVPEPCENESATDCFSHRWIKDRCEYGYKNGELHGPMIVVAENGDTIRKATFSNGQLQGPHYSRTKNTATWSNYLNGKEHGRFKIIEYDANTVTYGLMQFGEPVGIWETRLALEGKDNLLSTTRINGTEKIKTGYDFTEGFKKYEAQYLDGSLTNIKQFDNQKNIVATFSFQLEDSTIIVSTHLFGREEKICTKRVDEVVKLMMIPGYFIDNWAESPANKFGVLHGLQRFRDARGKVMYERTYNHGKLNGTVLEVSGSEEELIRKAVYENGALIGENYFDIKTKKLAKGKFLVKDKNGLFEKIRLKDGVRQ